MAVQSGQKFIKQNRAPRVQIEYDIELEGAQKKVDLPFVMGVMADLSGNPAQPLGEVASRKFQQIDAENFDTYMQTVKPRVAVTVPNTLTGQGNIALDLTFDSLADFAPDKIADKVEPLKQLKEQRARLHALKTHIDGKAKVEEELGKILADKAKLEERVKSRKKA